MAKVSVVVPIYNAGKRLNRCIESIINQTFSNIEIILVNDGSTDCSLDICNKYRVKDKRIIIIDKKNEGSIKTRRRGLESSNGEFVVFVDADDWIDSRFVEILYKEITENCCDVVTCNTYRVLGDNAIVKRKNNSSYFSNDRIYEGEEIKNELVTAWFYGHPFPPGLCAKIYKKDILINSGKYLNRIIFLGDDLFYNIEIFNKASRVKIINAPLYYYRIGGFTGKYMPNHFQDIINGYEIQKDIIKKHYIDSKDKQYRGISIMLLNSFKTTLQNIMNSGLPDNKIQEIIKNYTKNDSILEAISNDGSIKYFDNSFLNAIKDSNVQYLFNIGKQLSNKSKKKKALLNIVTKLNIL